MSHFLQIIILFLLFPITKRWLMSLGDSPNDVIQDSAPLSIISHPYLVSLLRI